jgi:hypothetical protein
MLNSMLAPNTSTDVDNEQGGALSPGGGEENAAEGADDPIQGNALGCLSSESGFRKFCHSVFTNRCVSTVVMLGIVTNIVILALQGPQHTLGTRFDEFVEIFDINLTALFLLEAIVGVCGLGFVVGPTTYLRNPWNVLDFVVLVGILLSYVMLLFTGTNVEAGAVRAFRALRPLRSLRLFAGLQGILDALQMTLPYVLSILALLMFFLLIFSTAGIALFSGALTQACISEPTFCSVPQVAVALRGTDCGSSANMASGSGSDSLGTFPESVCPPSFGCGVCNTIPLAGSGDYPADSDFGFDRWYENEWIGFDNVLQASLTLFVVTTMDEWTLVSHRLWV